MIFQVLFTRNPFTYDTDYRSKIIRNLSFVFSQPIREVRESDCLIIDLFFVVILVDH